MELNECLVSLHLPPNLAWVLVQYLQVGFLWTGAVNVCHYNQLLNGLALGGIQDWNGAE